MDARATAAAILQRELGAHGVDLLEEAGLPHSWTRVLADVPEASLAGAGPERLLQVIRDHLASRDLRAAAAFTRRVLEQRTRHLGADHPDTLVELAVMGELASRAGKHQRATAWLDQAFEGVRSRVDGRDPRLAAVAANRGAHLVRIGALGGAESMFEVALRVRRETAPQAVGRAAAQLAEVLLRRDKVVEALPYLQEAWQGYKERHGAHDPRTLQRARTLAAVAVKLGELDSAIPVLRDLHAEASRRGDREDTAFVAFELGMALYRSPRTREEGYRLVEQSVRFTREEGNPHPELPRRITAWSEIAARHGRAEEAEGLLREALEAERRLFGDTSAAVGARYVQLARLCRDSGRHADALGWLDPGVALLRTTLGDDEPATKRACQLLVELLFEEANAARGRRDRDLARRLIGRARTVGEAVLGADHTDVRRVFRFTV